MFPRLPSPEADSVLGSKALKYASSALITHLLIAIILLVAWAIAFFRYDAGDDTKKAKFVRSVCFMLATPGTLILWMFDMAFFGNVMTQLRNNELPADYEKATCTWKRGKRE